MKNYTKNHQKSRNFNIFLLTSAIFRGLRSVFLKTIFHCIRNISESLYLKNYCVISFFSKIIKFFRGVESTSSSPAGYDNFLPPLSSFQDLVKEVKNKNKQKKIRKRRFNKNDRDQYALLRPPSPCTFSYNLKYPIPSSEHAYFLNDTIRCFFYNITS